LQGGFVILPVSDEQSQARGGQGPNLELDLRSRRRLGFESRGEDEAVDGELRESGMGQSSFIFAGKSNSGNAAGRGEGYVRKFQFRIRESLPERERVFHSGTGIPRRDQSVTGKKNKPRLPRDA